MTHLPHPPDRHDPSLPIALWIFAAVVIATFFVMAATGSPHLRSTFDPASPPRISTGL
jgi:hypothetical protein